MKIKQDLTTHLIALQENGYSTLINSKMKTKRVKNAPICQETQAEEASAQDEKTIVNN